MGALGGFRSIFGMLHHRSGKCAGRLLAPVDASGFLDQFEFHSSRDPKRDLHPLRATVLDAIETAAAEPDGTNILDVLCRLSTLNAKLARSKSLRKVIDDKERVTFVPPLRCDDWSAALRDLEADPEFEVARALASIRGREKQPDGTYSEVQPLLGSLVPLQRSQHGWFLPDRPSPQAAWTGIDLARDLASVLARRHGLLDGCSTRGRRDLYREACNDPAIPSGGTRRPADRIIGRSTQSDRLAISHGSPRGGVAGIRPRINVLTRCPLPTHPRGLCSR